MGNCNCLERARAKVTAWGGDYVDGDDEYWGTAEKNGGGDGGAGSSPARRVKIRMTKGQLRRLLDGAGSGAAIEDVVAEIMRMGDVHVEPEEAAPPSKLETIQEDLDE